MGSPGSAAIVYFGGLWSELMPSGMKVTLTYDEKNGAFVYALEGEKSDPNVNIYQADSVPGGRPLKLSSADRANFTAWLMGKLKEKEPAKVDKPEAKVPPEPVMI